MEYSVHILQRKHHTTTYYMSLKDIRWSTVAIFYKGSITPQRIICHSKTLVGVQCPYFTKEASHHNVLYVTQRHYLEYSAHILQRKHHTTTYYMSLKDIRWSTVSIFYKGSITPQRIICHSKTLGGVQCPYFTKEASHHNVLYVTQRH